MRLSQQQLRFVKLLELNAPELDEAVERELEDNPALGVKEETDEDTRRYPLYHNPRSEADDTPFAPVDNSDTIYDNLYDQLSERSLTPEVEQAAEYIIGNLDSNGYLTRPLHLLVNDMAFGPGIEVSEEEALEALNVVRSLEPAGIGARNLQDCLEMQLVELPQSERRDDALRIIRESYDSFVMKHKKKIVSQLKIGEPRTEQALSLILSLNPKPGSALGVDPSKETNIVIPDFIVDNEDGEITISLNNRIPELQIEQSFAEAVAELDRQKKLRGERNGKKGGEFITSRYNDARDFIRILSQRQQTMMAVMTAIVKIQKEYFLTEDVYRLKPMMIKTVAEETGYDLSVISRATTNKFVMTPWGIFPLRFFFSDTIGESEAETGELTNRKIEAEIAALVEGEDKHHPLSDQLLMEEMNARGYDVSRRTVAKYRDRQGIPVARLRKVL